MTCTIEHIIWDAMMWMWGQPQPSHGASYPTYEQAGDREAAIQARIAAVRIRALPLPPEPEPRPYVPDSFDALITAARQEAIKAMRKIPQPNYVISKIAEEAGEVVKAAIHCAEGRETADNVRGEMKQLIAMLYRLWAEGDGVHGLAAVGDDPHPINNLPPEPEPPIVAKMDAALRTWPKVLALIREYDEAFPYAAKNGDDETVTEMDRAMKSLAELAKWREGRKG